MQFLKKIFSKILPSANERALAKQRNIVKQILALDYTKLTDAELKDKTNQFRQELINGKTLDDILVPAFATVREAASRTLGIVHYPEQLLGGISLHRGMIVEMKTGEGKTLVATLPAYLNALKSKVHIVTVNDYLAKRDAEETSKIHNFLGLTVGCIQENMQDLQRKEVYACDIVYATNNQLGFDYLRDNMKYDKAEICQAGLNYVIIDEADSVLIDEARTPLIISGMSERSSDTYAWVCDIVATLDETDYEKDEKMRSAILNEAGIEKIEAYLKLEGMLSSNGTLYEAANIDLVHSINQALKAKVLYKRDIDYLVKDGKVYIIDEFTGRVLEGRRYSDGLHQAIEAKEKVEVQAESNTMASITFQKFFALYDKISGMSGTCMGESEEFKEIYKVDTIEIPTHKPMIRKDLNDEIYRTFDEKFKAIIKELKEANEKGQPVLVITGSIEASEIFSHGFHEAGLKHQVLNAKYHKEEAEIIAEAGMPGAITIATNMAGRGTDIQLGGNLKMRLKKLKAQGLSNAEIQAKKPEVEKEIKKAREVVIKAGGLYVLGTERNESRRVDDQARGRSGRQGDIGKSKFFLSLDDNLIRIFGSSEKLNKWLLRFGMKEGESITHSYISRAIARAQAAVEARNFDWRKNVFKYDQVLDEQRKMIYKYRNRFLDEADVFEQMKSFVEFQLHILLGSYSHHENIQNIKEFYMSTEISLLQQAILRLFGIEISVEQVASNTKDTVNEQIRGKVLDKLNHLKESQGMHLKFILLKTIDDLWRDHLYILDSLRNSVNLKAYAQKDPLNEYKKEAFLIFENLLNNFRDTAISFFFHLEDDSKTI